MAVTSGVGERTRPLPTHTRARAHTRSRAHTRARARPLSSDTLEGKVKLKANERRETQASGRRAARHDGRTRPSRFPRGRCLRPSAARAREPPPPRPLRARSGREARAGGRWTQPGGLATGGGLSSRVSGLARPVGESGQVSAAGAGRWARAGRGEARPGRRG